MAEHGGLDPIETARWMGNIERSVQDMRKTLEGFGARIGALEARHPNGNGWRRSAGFAGGGLGAGGFIYWLIELLRGVQHIHPPG